MKPRQAVGMGLPIVALTAPVHGVGLLPDPLGWPLVLAGLRAARDGTGLAAQRRFVSMSQPLGRAVGTSLPGLVASLLAWGVTDAHWLPGPDGIPVVWLATATEKQRETLEVQRWLPTQVRMLLMRHGVLPEEVSGVRVMFDSGQGREALLDRA